MKQIEILLVIIAVIVGSCLFVFGSIYLIIAHCLTNKSRFEWLPFGQLYKKNCMLCCAQSQVSNEDVFLIIDDDQTSYTIDTDDILNGVGRLDTCTAIDIPNDPNAIQEYKDYVEDYANSFSKECQTEDIMHLFN